MLNASFDFSYFDSRSQYLEFYPAEFTTKYNLYRKDRNNRWQELDSPTSFAIKCNNDILDYAIPPLAGILREVYDLEDYKALKLTKTTLENYAMLVMKLGITETGEWQMDLDKAKDFWRNLDSVLPEEVGSVLSPMDINKISFERTNTGESNTTADAEQNLFSAAGVSSLLFNNDKASSNALLLSIKADQAITFGIVKSIEDMVNRFIQSQSYGKNFKVTFLDCSQFNRKELGDMYLKACQNGLPFISMYAASQGLSQSEMDCMSYLENDVLGLADMFRPLQTSSTLSSASQESNGATDEGGAPKKEIGDLTDSGEKSQENEDS
nr:MAG TPA: portal protein [Caudoviricetes sp.]